MNTALLANYGGVLGTIAVDTTSSAATPSGGASSLTFSHTVNSGSDSILIVEVADRHGGAGDPVASVTYGGQSLTLIGSADLPNTESAEIWYLLAPTVGTANVVVTLTGSCHFVAGATDYFGVNQTTPLGTLVTGDGKQFHAFGHRGFRGWPVGRRFARHPGRFPVDHAHRIRADRTLEPSHGNRRQAMPSAAAAIRAGAASVTMSWTENQCSQLGDRRRAADPRFDEHAHGRLPRPTRSTATPLRSAR